MNEAPRVQPKERRDSGRDKQQIPTRYERECDPGGEANYFHC
jgi:hypothetical protein